MLGIDPALAILFSDDVLREVFKLVAKERTIRLRDLRQGLVGYPDLRESLDKLKAADLIKERAAPVDAFNTYYVTANGLTAERQLQLTESAAGSPASPVPGSTR